MPIGNQFYTVGYQGVSLDQLLDSLVHAGVTFPTVLRAHQSKKNERARAATGQC